MISKATIPYDVLILTNRTFIDGTGAEPIFGGTVVLHTNCILAVGPTSGSDVSPDSRVIDVRGGTILPGFIDAHVHTATDLGVRRQLLTGGVTAICDLGSR
jgi:imidazolonepropionase-like amidohydrolase